MHVVKVLLLFKFFFKENTFAQSENSCTPCFYGDLKTMATYF